MRIESFKRWLTRKHKIEKDYIDRARKPHILGTLVNPVSDDWALLVTLTINGGKKW